MNKHSHTYTICVVLIGIISCILLYTKVNKTMLLTCMVLYTILAYIGFVLYNQSINHKYIKLFRKKF